MVTKTKKRTDIDDKIKRHAVKDYNTQRELYLKSRKSLRDKAAKLQEAVTEISQQAQDLYEQSITLDALVDEKTKERELLLASVNQADAAFFEEYSALANLAGLPLTPFDI
jgi:cysteinyl-tRNA synthetase